MTDKPVDPQAFPARQYAGMSLRDYFAGQALAGMLACSDTGGSIEDIAGSAYRLADAMMKERFKDNG